MLKTSIPFVDLRGKSPIDLLRAYPDKASALIQASRSSFGRFARMISGLALRFADKRSHAWLKRTWNPYLYEIESYADVVTTPGMYALNMSYEWGCTSGAYRTDQTITMLRVLDWPFPELGRHVMVILQDGKAGDYYNVTWPGMAGVTTGMAPNRFSATLNMAPMRKHNLGLVGDWLKNRLIMRKQLGIPPAHLLRQVFEQAADYETAKQMLIATPVAAPVVYVLAGMEPGQACVIERLETSAEIRELGAGQGISAANHFTTALNSAGQGWRPREIDSHGRYRQSCTIQGYDLRMPNFDWLQAPIINPYTRVCVISDAATGRLTVQGYEGSAQVTDLFDLPYNYVAPEMERQPMDAIKQNAMTFAPMAEVM